jgi:HAE1 family hydrophobic/amphiphilic exporter-1
MQGWFHRPRTTDVTAAEATKVIQEALPRKPGIKMTVGREEEAQETSGESIFTIVLNGEDPETLDRIKHDLEDVLARTAGVLGVQGRNEPPPNELGLVIDRERSQRYGANPQHIAGVVGTALMGMQLPKYREDGKEIPVRVRFREQDRESLTELADFQVPTARGELIPLSALTDPRFLPTPETIVRRDKRLARTIVLQLEAGQEQQARERLTRMLSAIDLPEGIAFAADDRRADFQEDLGGLFYALALSVVFIYLLMCFLFESFILPLSIIFTIPLSAVGVWWGHWLTGRNIDFLGVVAIILLVGVVVNNGIVLIDYVNRLRLRGLERYDALLTASTRRFRPIMMTAITTIAGLVPLAFVGANSIGLSYTSFSITLIGGMTAATLLTSLVVPVLYTLFDDARETISAVLRRETRRTEVEAS